MSYLSRSSQTASDDFEPCPAGDLQLVVVDVVDLGWEIKFFEGVSKGYHPRVQIVYQAVGDDDDGVPVLREDDSRFLVFGRRNWVTVDEKGNLYKEICSIIGTKQFNDLLDAGNFDTESLIGKNILASVVHNEYKEKIYANIESPRPWGKKMGPFEEPEGYLRRSERENYAPPEISCWASLDEARAHFEAKGEEFRPGKAPAPKPAPKPAAPTPATSIGTNPTPRQTRAAKVAELAQDDDEMDDDDPFADD